MIRKTNIRDSYKDYKKENENPVDMKTYTLIIGGLMKFIILKVLSGFDVQLFYRMGNIGIRGRKFNPTVNAQGEIRGVIPHWSETKKLWDSNPIAKAEKKLVYLFNEHSDGIRYKIVWWKANVIIKNKMYYGLVPSRPFKRAIWAAIMGGKQYIVINKDH